MDTLQTLRTSSMATEQDNAPFTTHPDPIANALDLTPNTAPLQVLPKETKDVPEGTEEDIKYARENLYHLAERGRDALEDLLELANQSQHPRAYEVVGQLIKTLTDTNDRIVAIQKKALELLEPKDGPSKVTNNLFVGNTSELTRLLGGNARDILKKDT